VYKPKPQTQANERASQPASKFIKQFLALSACSVRYQK
jgi:hypothetical protein